MLMMKHGNHVLIAPRRHVSRWRDLSPEERNILVDRIAPVQAKLEDGEAIASVAIDENGPHLHLRVLRPHPAIDMLPGLPSRASVDLGWAGRAARSSPSMD